MRDQQNEQCFFLKISSLQYSNFFFNLHLNKIQTNLKFFVTQIKICHKTQIECNILL